MCCWANIKDDKEDDDVGDDYTEDMCVAAQPSLTKDIKRFQEISKYISTGSKESLKDQITYVKHIRT